MHLAYSAMFRAAFHLVRNYSSRERRLSKHQFLEKKSSSYRPMRTVRVSLKLDVHSVPKEGLRVVMFFAREAAKPNAT